jgi:hypothetical protein
MRQNSTKFDLGQKTEFKKSFKLYCQTLLKVLTKVGLNFVHFAWMKVRKMKPRVKLCSKSPFLPRIKIEEIFNEILKFV